MNTTTFKPTNLNLFWFIVIGLVFAHVAGLALVYFGTIITSALMGVFSGLTRELHKRWLIATIGVTVIGALVVFLKIPFSWKHLVTAFTLALMSYTLGRIEGNRQFGQGK